MWSLKNAISLFCLIVVLSRTKWHSPTAPAHSLSPCQGDMQQSARTKQKLRPQQDDSCFHVAPCYTVVFKENSKHLIGDGFVVFVKTVNKTSDFLLCNQPHEKLTAPFTTLWTQCSPPGSHLKIMHIYWYMAFNSYALLIYCLTFTQSVMCPVCKSYVQCP